MRETLPEKSEFTFETDEEITDFLEIHRDAIRSEFEEALNTLINKYRECSVEKLAFVCISFLRTGMLVDGDIIRIDCLNQNKWKNIETAHVYISLDFLTNHIRDIVCKETTDSSDRSKLTLQESDIMYISLFERYMEQLPSFIENSIIFYKQDLPYVVFEYGEYLGKTKVL